jgi:phage shock protein A
MSLWKRFTRAMKGLFGGAISSIEDPKLILEQNIRELNDQVPKMNESIATVKSSVVMLEKELKKYQNEHDQLESKIKAAINQGRDDIAANYATRLETTKQNIQKTQEELESARNAYNKALEVKKAFMREREKKIKEAEEAMRAHERSQWQAKVADAMEQFEVGGQDQTHDEMLNRLDQQTAKNEARMDMALESTDTQSYKIDEEAENLRAMELVNKYKMEMGKGDTQAEQQTGSQQQEESSSQSQQT